MKVVVLGNIGSGKTTLSRALADRLSGFETIAIDDYRKCYGDGTMETEIVAKNKFLNAIIPEEKQIIEIMGIGDTGEKLFKKISGFPEKKVILILRTSLEECILRLKERQWDIPYPAPAEKAFILAGKTEQSIRSGDLYRKWSHMNMSKVIEIDKITECIIKQIILIIQDRD